MRVGEDGQPGALGDRLGGFGETRPGEELAVARDDDLVGLGIPVLGAIGGVGIVGHVDRFHPEFAAKRGEHGQGSNRTGHSGVNLELPVPVGTLVYQESDDEREPAQLLADLSFADLLLWVRGNDGRYLCAAQVRPTTGPTAYQRDLVEAGASTEYSATLDDPDSPERFRVRRTLGGPVIAVITRRRQLPIPVRRG